MDELLQSSVTICLNGDRTIFYSGEVISGYCKVTCSQPKDVPCLKVRLKGHARVHWSETHTNHNDETYTVNYGSDVELVKNVETDVGMDWKWNGKKSLQFDLETPRNLVTSFEGEYGYVRYWLEADVLQKFYQSPYKPEGVAAIKIVQSIDANSPQYSIPVSRKTKTCCVCCPIVSPAVDVKANRSAYCPSDVACFTARFKKRKASEKPYCKLVQTTTYFAQPGHLKMSTVSFPLTPLNKEQEAEPAASVIRFQIPIVPPSMELSNIQLNYSIEIGLLLMDGGGRNDDVCLPVVIASIPFHDGCNPQDEQPPDCFKELFDGQEMSLPADDHFSRRWQLQRVSIT